MKQHFHIFSLCLIILSSCTFNKNPISSGDSIILTDPFTGSFNNRMLGKPKRVKETTYLIVEGTKMPALFMLPTIKHFTRKGSIYQIDTLDSDNLVVTSKKYSRNANNEIISAYTTDESGEEPGEIIAKLIFDRYNWSNRIEVREYHHEIDGDSDSWTLDTIYEIDLNNRIIRKVSAFGYPGLQQSTLFFLNESADIVSFHYLNPEGELISQSSYEYGDDNFLVMEKMLKDGKETRSLVKYSIDRIGNWIEAKVIAENGDLSEPFYIVEREILYY